MPRRFFGFSIVFVVALACSHDDTASAHPRNVPSSPDDGVPPRPSVIAPSSQPYRVVPVSVGGTITGTVDFEGTVPVAAIIRPPSSDQKVCGNSIVEKNVALAGTRVGGAVVWLTDIRSGKAFPIERRFELTNDACTLDPYVQAISTSGTLNVSNDDRTLHTNRFINVGTGTDCRRRSIQRRRRSRSGGQIQGARRDRSGVRAAPVVPRVDRRTRPSLLCADHCDGHVQHRWNSRREIPRPRVASGIGLRRRQRDRCSRSADKRGLPHPAKRCERPRRSDAGASGIGPPSRFQHARGANSANGFEHPIHDAKRSAAAKIGEQSGLAHERVPGPELSAI